MTQEQDRQPAVIRLPYPKKETVAAVPEEVPLDPQSQSAIAEIQKREGHTQSSPEDVVAMAVEVFNVLTEHLSQKDSNVILHTVGESSQTLDIKNSAGSYTVGVRTAHKRVQPPKTKM